MSTSNTARKTVCSITRQEFASHAKPLPCMIGKNPMPAMAREFSTGSLGYYASGKAMVEIDGKLVPCQVSVTVTVIGSKELPRTTTTPFTASDDTTSTPANTESVAV